MDILDKTYDRASCEIEEILQHPKFDRQDVEILGELIDVLKDVEMIYGYQDNMNGYSKSDGYSYGRSNRMMPSYNRGSYSRGRSMRNDNKDMILDHLQDIMNMTTDEKDRMAISKLVQEMESH